MTDKGPDPGEGQLEWSLRGSVFAKARDTQEGKILVNDGNSRTPRRRQEPHRLKAKYFLLLLREARRP